MRGTPAYNCGPGNVRKAPIRRSEERKHFWGNLQLLPKETRSYIPAIPSHALCYESFGRFIIFHLEGNLLCHSS